MSELLSAIDGFRAESLPELPDALIEEEFAELHRASELIELERLRRLAEIDRRGLFERDGHLSAAAWLSSTCNVSSGAARASATTARALESMPLTRAGIESGDVSISAARVLVDAREADPEAFAISESMLVDAARIHSVGDLRRVTAYWREACERQRGLAGDGLRERRRLHASVSFAGMVRVDGDLDPETGECLLTALRAVVDAESRSGDTDDDRTPAQRRADALGEICRQWLDLGDRPTVASERPHVTVMVDAHALAESAETVAGSFGVRNPHDATLAMRGELDHAGPVARHIVRGLSCDGSVMRVVLNGRSEPLDVGRRSKVVPPSMRRAVIVRDRRCRFPGCDRPHTWCDAHHVVHWADGGPTATSNLVLLCRRHHRLVHRPGGFGLELLDGRPVFRRPDGSVLEDRAPP